MTTALRPTSTIDLARAPARLAVVLAVAVTGCDEAPAAPPPLPPAESVALEGIGEGPVSGTLDGEAFATADARFRVVSYEGRERVELLFSDRAIERCGLPMDRPDTLLWLRFPGRTHLDPGRYELLGEAPAQAAEGQAPTEGQAAEGQSPAEGQAAQAAPAFSVHWERPVGEGLEHQIRAGHRGVGRVEILQADPLSTTPRLRGRLHVCFAAEGGGEPECVAGTFDAAPCWSRIDGRTLREPPGLDDEALLPRPREPRPPRRTYP